MPTYGGIIGDYQVIRTPGTTCSDRVSCTRREDITFIKGDINVHNAYRDSIPYDLLEPTNRQERAKADSHFFRSYTPLVTRDPLTSFAYPESRQWMSWANQLKEAEIAQKPPLHIPIEEIVLVMGLGRDRELVQCLERTQDDTTMQPSHFSQGLGGGGVQLSCDAIQYVRVATSM